LYCQNNMACIGRNIVAVCIPGLREIKIHCGQLKVIVIKKI